MKSFTFEISRTDLIFWISFPRRARLKISKLSLKMKLYRMLFHFNAYQIETNYKFLALKNLVTIVLISCWTRPQHGTYRVEVVLIHRVGFVLTTVLGSWWARRERVKDKLSNTSWCTMYVYCIEYTPQSEAELCFSSCIMKLFTYLQRSTFSMLAVHVSSFIYLALLFCSILFSWLL